MLCLLCEDSSNQRYAWFASSHLALSSMGGRKKGGKKKGSRKRKANVWDDADVTSKRGALSSETDDKRRKISTKGSMMGQWKTQKMVQRMKERRFVDSTVTKKQQQRKQYEETWERTVDAIYKKKEDENEEKDKLEEASEEDEHGESNESESEEEDGSDEDMMKKKKSLFDEFVKTFTAEEPIEEEEEEEDEEEELLEVENEVENGVENDEEQVTDKEEEEKDREKEKEADKENDEQVAAMERDDEEQLDENDEKEEHEDPYRRRYLLSSFHEKDAQTFDTQPRKFVPIELSLAEKDKYDVTYRSGMEHHVEGLAGVVTTPEIAIAKKPFIRSRLLNTWKQRGFDLDTKFTQGSIEHTLLQHCLAYLDVFFAGQTYENTSTLRQLSAMHVLNHVIKARDTVTRNNERIKRQEEENENEKEYRDQGFCRARVLVLLPLRSAALAFVTHLMDLLPSTVATFHNKERFFTEFGSQNDPEEEEVKNGTHDQDTKEWQRVFHEGNNDDCFQLGLAFSRKAMRFYSDYEHADVILASPLGLRHQLGDEIAQLDDLEAKDKSELKLSRAFLSSIEVCIVDSASLMMMQNLEHLRTVLRATNLPPKEAPHADFARVRDWNLAFLASYFRQTIVFAHGVEPALNALLTQTCRNVTGMVKYMRRYEGTAAISRVVPRVKQIFQRVDRDVVGRLSAHDEVEVRFQYFKRHIFEPLVEQPRKHVLIFIPSYFDYVRVRNLFHDKMNQKLIRSVQCCEYTTRTQVSRARTTFFHGHCHVMLYTERFHFYHQYQIRGVHQVIWYGVPVMPEFYAEIMNLLPNTSENHDDRAETTSIALFSRLDLLRMQRIVGNQRAQRMCQVKATKPTFLFC